jgi:hypothetical protein
MFIAETKYSTGAHSMRRPAAPSGLPLAPMLLMAASPKRAGPLTLPPVNSRIERVQAVDMSAMEGRPLRRPSAGVPPRHRVDRCCEGFRRALLVFGAAALPLPPTQPGGGRRTVRDAAHGCGCLRLLPTRSTEESGPRLPIRLTRREARLRVENDKPLQPRVFGHPGDHAVLYLPPIEGVGAPHA